VQRAPGIPHALCFEGVGTNLGRYPRRGKADVYLKLAGQREFALCRKHLSPKAEIQLAVRYQPVYNPALRYFR
jgi:hypothetical protein